MIEGENIWESIDQKLLHKSKRYHKYETVMPLQITLKAAVYSTMREKSN